MSVDERYKRLWARMQEGHEIFYPFKGNDFYGERLGLDMVEIILSLADQNNVASITCHRRSKLEQCSIYLRFSDNVDNYLFRSDLLKYSIPYNTVGWPEKTEIIIYDHHWESTYW
jgi:hypothetical protein